MADVIATKSFTQLQAKDVSKTTNKVDLLIRHYRINVPPEIGAPSYLMSDIPPIPPLPMPNDSRSSDTESIATVQELLKSKNCFLLNIEGMKVPSPEKSQIPRVRLSSILV